MNISGDVFGERQNGPNKYSAKRLEEKLKMIIEDSETPLRDRRKDHCRTFVVAKRYLTVGDRALFKSYRIDGTEIKCSVMQAARATSAAPTYFPPQDIDMNKYIDGGIGYNNPSMEAIREAGRIWPSRRIGCLVSIGTGLMESFSAENRSREQMGRVVGKVVKTLAPGKAEELTVAEYCTEIATDCQAVHQDVLDHPAVEKYGTKRRYYRFNVMTGLQNIALDEHMKLPMISERTEAYLSDPDQRRLLSDCVSLLSSPEELFANVGS